MRSTIFLWIFIGLGLMGVLGLVRFPFALRFWVHMRRLGYLYVAFVIALAALSVVFGRRL
ncbi:MAG TPA: hypothetical protein VIO16_07140 [Dehalococcoidia bacterium]|jgi:hypothetical protein